MLELYGFVMATLTQPGAPKDLAVVGDALLDLSGKLAANMEGLGQRRIRVPPSWGLGAVQAEEPEAGRTASAPQESRGGSAVASVAQAETTDGFETVGRADDIPEGRMRTFEVGGRRVAVANSRGNLYAFDDVCTHRGCPLHRGRLVGTTVTCPCHGSQFDVRTGKVMRGPATEAELVFETSVEDGDLKIKV